MDNPDSMKKPVAVIDAVPGLQSLAHAAAEIQTVDLLDDTGDQQVIEIVDADVNVGDADHVKNAYVFKGQSEFTFKATIGKNQKKGIFNSYMSAPISGFCELSLVTFERWFKNFRFHPIVNSPEDGSWKWVYAVVFMCPSSEKLKDDQKNPKKERHEYFGALLKKFYDSLFEPTEETTHRICRSVDNDMSIMVVAKKLRKTTANPKSIQGGDVIVVTAVSFQRLQQPTDPVLTVAFITFLGVAPSNAKHPSTIVSWRRQGFGLFMLVHVVKWFAAHYDHKQIDVYLQCHEASAFQFYRMVGFRHKNALQDDGFNTLPWFMQISFRSMRKGWSSLDSPFIFHDPQSQAPPPKLMQLPSGTLQHLNEVDIHEDESGSPAENKSRMSDCMFWCNYPPPKFGVFQHRLVYHPQEIEECRKDLKVFSLLLPGTITELLPASSMQIRGDMLLEYRIQHSEVKGKKWMVTGEMDLMLTTLLLDGRYEDSCFILPCSLVVNVEKAFNLYVRYKKMMSLTQKMTSEEGNNTPDDMRGVIVRELRQPPEQISHDYHQHMNDVLVKIIHRNPGLLSRKMLVFPATAGNMHWHATFVFNAGFIQESIDAPSDTDAASSMLLPCFFRYCSIQRDGDRLTPVKHGIVWFLNLCYSYEMHQKSRLASATNPTNNAMKWYEPFGSRVDGNMLGSKAFPSIRLGPLLSCLPKQEDGCNCGIGVCAAIGILLRDVVNCNGNENAYEDFFSRSQFKVMLAEETEEPFVLMPRGSLSPIPTKEVMVWSDDYLKVLRVEWFMFLDKMAELQYVIVPKRMNPKNKVLDCYSVTKSIVTWPYRSEDRVDAKEAKLQALLPPPKGDDDDQKIAATIPLSSAAGGGDSQAPPPVLPTPEEDDDDKKSAAYLSGMAVGPMAPQPPPSSGEESKAPAVSPPDPHVVTQDDDDKKGTKSEVEVVKSNELCPVDPVPFKTKERRDKIEKGDLFRRLIANWNDPELDKEEAKKEKKRINAEKKRKGKPSASESDDGHVAKKVCTQSRASVQDFHDKYLANPQPEPPMVIVDGQFEGALKKFIAKSFEAWNWNSDEAHQGIICKWALKLKSPKVSDKSKEWIRSVIQGLKDERRYYKHQFTNEFMFLNQAMVKGMKYVKDNDSFVARLVYNDPDPADPNVLVKKEEELKVDEAWVRSEFSKEDIQHIINMRQTKHWTQVPRDVQVLISKKKVTRVRYLPATMRMIVDYEAVALKVKAELAKPEVPNPEPTVPDRRNRKSRVGQTPSKSPREAEPEKADEEEEEEQLPRKAITIREKWMGKLENGKETELDEAFVRMAFGEAFADSLKSSIRGFVDIPVGDYKPSHLVRHPNLIVQGAPSIRFNQSDGKDLCVSKSLASAFHALRFVEEALKIDQFGEEIMKGAIVDALDNVVRYAKTVLPSWIVCVRQPKQFNWKKDIKPRDVFVGVLFASDSSCCHAVTIHCGFVYDANEKVAIPLCQEALDYCTSTEYVKSTFIKFRRGYIFHYEGTKKEKTQKMMLFA